MRKSYPSDLTDEQYSRLESHLPPPKRVGRPRKVDLREVLNAIFYLNRTGCQWRALPHDFPKWEKVYYYFAKWRDDGTWTILQQALREQVRDAKGKQPTPSLLIIDSQSTKSTEVGGVHSFDGNKKINGRKRHILVDSLGLVVAVLVTGAGCLDGEAAKGLLGKLNQKNFPRVQLIIADQAYLKCGLPEWVKCNGYYQLEIKVSDPTTKGFKVIQWRWIVERTFAWMGRYRRNSKHYEMLIESSEAMVEISSLHRMLNRVSPKPNPAKFCYRKTA